MGKISRKRSIRSLLEASEGKEPNKFSIDFSGVPIARNQNSSQGKINITDNRLIIENLRHFTEYTIDVFACQDVKAIEHYCSAQTASRSVRTDPISKFLLKNKLS